MPWRKGLDESELLEMRYYWRLKEMGEAQTFIRRRHSIRWSVIRDPGSHDVVFGIVKNVSSS